MLAAMAAFILNDAVLKLAAENLPTGEIIAVRGVMATVLVFVIAYATGVIRGLHRLLQSAILIRVGAEVVAALTYLSALFHMPIANVTAILQATPLAVTAAAAVFLGERVHWRRWLAAIVGLAGVLMIVRPGLASFTWWSVVALGGVAAITLRDLITRRIDPGTPSFLVAAFTMPVVALMGFALGPFEQWVVPSARDLGLLACAAVLVLVGHYLIILAMRAGDVSAVAPFRYSIIVWAILLGIAIWGEFPDAMSLAGTAIIIGAGIYTFSRERRLARSIQAPAPPA